MKAKSAVDDAAKKPSATYKPLHCEHCGEVERAGEIIKIGADKFYVCWRCGRDIRAGTEMVGALSERLRTARKAAQDAKMARRMAEKEASFANV